MTEGAPRTEGIPPNPTPSPAPPKSADELLSVPVKPVPVDEGGSEKSKQAQGAGAQEHSSGPKPAVGQQPDPARIAKPQQPTAGNASKQRGKWMSRIDVGLGTQLILALFQALLFGTTIWQAIIAQDAAVDGHTAADAAKRSADTAEQNLKLAERPHLTLEPNPILDLANNGITSAIIDRGLGPGLDVTINWEINTRSELQIETNIDKDYNNVPGDSKKFIDEADKEYQETITLNPVPAFKSFVAGMPDGPPVFLRLLGYVSYNDLLDYHHTSYFCILYQGDKKLQFHRTDICPHPPELIVPIRQDQHSKVAGHNS